MKMNKLFDKYDTVYFLYNDMDRDLIYMKGTYLGEGKENKYMIEHINGRIYNLKPDTIFRKEHQVKCIVSSISKKLFYYKSEDVDYSSGYKDSMAYSIQDQDTIGGKARRKVYLEIRVDDKVYNVLTSQIQLTKEEIEDCTLVSSKKFYKREGRVTSAQVTCRKKSTHTPQDVKLEMYKMKEMSFTHILN